MALNFVKGQDGTDTVLVDGQSQDLETTEEVVTQTVESIESVDDSDAQVSLLDTTLQSVTHQTFWGDGGLQNQHGLNVKNI